MTFVQPRPSPIQRVNVMGQVGMWCDLWCARAHARAAGVTQFLTWLMNTLKLFLRSRTSPALLFLLFNRSSQDTPFCSRAGEAQLGDRRIAAEGSGISQRVGSELHKNVSARPRRLLLVS